MTGPGWADEGELRPPDPRMVASYKVVFQSGPPPAPPRAAQPLGETETDHIVRPFIVTGGRTRPTDERLRVETLITAAPAALSAPLSFERRHIVELCQRPLSVAEVSHSLGIPIGVARVLIGDLLAERLVSVEEDVVGFVGRPSRDLLERIREGVRAL